MKNPTGIISALKENIALPDGLENLRNRYKAAKPFPHIIIDDLFPVDLIEDLAREIPPLTSDCWVRFNDENLKQMNLRSPVHLGETGFRLTAFLHSAGFLYFLSELTGIGELLPDPYLQGAGYHVLPQGGKFDVHVDRNTAYETGLTRRLALMTYLNKSWKHEYGGQLELWSSGASRCEVVVEPIFNRTIIFKVDDQNFHGVPNRVTCPEGRSRNSFVVYYHTAGVKDITPHPSIYATNRKKWTLRRTIKEMTPPILLRGLRKLRKAK